MIDISKKALALHKKNKGKIATLVTTPIKNKLDLSLAYTPGAAEVSSAIAKRKELVFDYTIKSHTVGIVTDGSAVLGLGIINLEDISAPRCFEIEARLQKLGIPVMHDDQHGTAVVALAGLINAAKVAKRKLSSLRIVIVGAGAAGSAIAKLVSPLVSDVISVDSRGIIYKTRPGLEVYKLNLARITNKKNLKGSMQDALVGADVVIGVSTAGILSGKDIALMAPRPIVFAMANPMPEIMPDEAKKAGAFIVATGRSDFSNQINNSLSFPGIFKGAMASKATRITDEMKLAAARALANLVKKPASDKIIPGPFDRGVVNAVSSAVSKIAKRRS